MERKRDSEIFSLKKFLKGKNESQYDQFCKTCPICLVQSTTTDVRRNDNEVRQRPKRSPLEKFQCIINVLILCHPVIALICLFVLIVI